MTPEQIATRMSEAQINLLFYPKGHHRAATRRALRNLGLIEWDQVTPLGLVVRQALKENSSG